MGELEDRLSSILNDPEQMRRISSLAQTLMGGESSASTGTAEGQGEEGLPGSLGSLLSPPRGGGDKAALLEALKPWLSEIVQRAPAVVNHVDGIIVLAKDRRNGSGQGSFIFGIQKSHRASPQQENTTVPGKNHLFCFAAFFSARRSPAHAPPPKKQSREDFDEVLPAFETVLSPQRREHGDDLLFAAHHAGQEHALVLRRGAEGLLHILVAADIQQM